MGPVGSGSARPESTPEDAVDVGWFPFVFFHLVCFLPQLMDDAGAAPINEFLFHVEKAVARLAAIRVHRLMIFENVR